MTSVKNILSVNDIPGPRPSLPFVGTSWLYFPIVGRYDMTAAMHEANRDKYERYGSICREEFSRGVPFIHVYDPEDIETVLNNQGRIPERPVMEAVRMFRQSHPELYNSVGLVNASGEEWHHLRRSLASVITQPRVVSAYLKPQNVICDDFVVLLNKLRDSETGMLQNLMEPLHRMALESSVMFCLDRRLNCMALELKEDSDAYRMIHASLELFESFQQLFYGLPLWKWFNTAAYRQLEQSEFTIYGVTSKYIKEVQDSTNANYKKDCDSNEDEPPSVAKALRSSEDIRDVHTEVVDFITAGIDTSAISLCFALHHLARHRHVQDALYEEIVRVIGADQPVTANALAQMAYLKACVKESFRLSPTAPNIVRIIPQDLVLGSYKIPKGTVVSCETMLAGRNPDHVACPDDYIPERWMPNPPAYLARGVRVFPFGKGSRMCPGRRFAEQEMYITIVKILQNFIIECDEKLESIYCFVMTPKPPVAMRFLPRRSSTPEDSS